MKKLFCLSLFCLSSLILAEEKSPITFQIINLNNSATEHDRRQALMMQIWFREAIVSWQKRSSDIHLTYLAEEQKNENVLGGYPQLEENLKAAGEARFLEEYKVEKPLDVSIKGTLFSSREDFLKQHIGNKSMLNASKDKQLFVWFEGHGMRDARAEGENPILDFFGNIALTKPEREQSIAENLFGSSQANSDHMRVKDVAQALFGVKGIYSEKDQRNICEQLKQRQKEVMVTQTSCFGGGVSSFTDLSMICFKKFNIDVFAKICSFSIQSPYRGSSGGSALTHGPTALFRKIQTDPRGNIQNVFDAVNDSVFQADEDMFASTDWVVYRWAQANQAKILPYVTNFRDSKNKSKYGDIYKKYNDSSLQHFYLDADPVEGINVFDIDQNKLNSLLAINKNSQDENIKHSITRYNDFLKYYQMMGNNTKAMENETFAELKKCIGSTVAMKDRQQIIDAAYAQYSADFLELQFPLTPILKGTVAKEFSVNEEVRAALANLSRFISPEYYANNVRVLCRKVYSSDQKRMDKCLFACNEYEKNPRNNNMLLREEVRQLIEDRNINFLIDTEKMKTCKPAVLSNDLGPLKDILDKAKQLKNSSGTCQHILEHLANMKKAQRILGESWRRMQRRTLVDLLFHQDKTSVYHRHYEGVKQCLKSFN